MCVHNCFWPPPTEFKGGGESALSGLPPLCDHTVFSLHCICRPLVCQNLSGMVGLLGRIWGYIGHWCLPIPRSKDLEGQEAITVYELFSCIW